MLLGVVDVVRYTFHLTTHSTTLIRPFHMTAGSTALATVPICQGPCSLVQCIAVNIMLLLTVFKEGAGNVSFWAADAYKVLQKH
jgi:hypothetical protein